MSLNVPPVTSRVTASAFAGRQTMIPAASIYSPTPPALPVTTTTEDSTSASINCQLDVHRQELIFESNLANPVKVGEWIVVTSVSKFRHFPRQKLTNNADKTRSSPRTL